MDSFHQITENMIYNSPQFSYRKSTKINLVKLVSNFSKFNFYNFKEDQIWIFFFNFRLSIYEV